MLRRLLASATFALAALALPAHAETNIVVHYPMPGFFKSVMEQISTEYMKQHPDVKITFASPSPTYEDGLQLALLRQAAGAPDMPDAPADFIGLNLVVCAMLAERNAIGVDLNAVRS